MDGALHGVVDRQASIAWFLETRRRTADMFDLLTEEAYYEQPIPLRHPIVFYEGHIPAFSINSLIKRGLGRDGLDEDLEQLFARGIDPEDQDSSDRVAIRTWPKRETVQQYADDADRAILDALEHAEIERSGHPVLHRGQAVFTVIEHEELHQETLAYMWHRLPLSRKRRPRDAGVSITDGAVPEPEQVKISAGRATLGAMLDEIPFGWDNEFPRYQVDVPVFAIDRHNVTNEQYLEFVEAGGYANPEWWSDTDWAWLTGAGAAHPPFWVRQQGEWFWRGMFELIPLPPSWPVYVSYAEASAYARWKKLRLPTEAEYHRAAFGAPEGSERAHPWGEAPPNATRGNFGFQHWDPVPVGSYPAGVSAWGVHDLVGNGWEWTSTVFEGFPGFRPMASYPEYSADFFDGLHYVIKGAAPVTATGLVRRSFRNWFRPHYPYVYTGFRCVEG
jgi:ergothioneine biosynthesis protein EgtB